MGGFFFPIVSVHAGFELSGKESVNEPQLDKTNKMTCPPSEDSNRPGHAFSLFRVFTVRMKKTWVLAYPKGAQRRLQSGCQS